MNDTLMRSFIAVADEGSISAAAKKLFVSAPSLTQRMDALEKELGFKVMVRSTQGIALTDAGVEFYAGSKSLLKRTEALISRCAREALINAVEASTSVAEQIRLKTECAH